MFSQESNCKMPNLATDLLLLDHLIQLETADQARKLGIEMDSDLNLQVHKSIKAIKSSAF